MALISSIIAAVAAKYGLVLAKDKGWLPKNFYLGKAVKELHQDNLENAIHNWQIAFEKDSDNLEVLAVREIIESEIDLKIRLLNDRIIYLQNKMQELGKKRFWSMIGSFNPLRKSREKYLNAMQHMDEAVAIMQKESQSFTEGLSVLEKLLETLYKKK